MAVFRIEKTRDYTVMSNHHLRNTNLSLKAKGLLSLMLSLPENWDYTTKGLVHICKDGVDSICAGVRELEKQGYVIRERIRNVNGQLGAIEYTILEQPRPPEPKRENPILDNPILGSPVLGKPEQENPAQLNTNESSKDKSITDLSNTDSFPFPSPPPPERRNEPPESKRKEVAVQNAAEIYREIILQNVQYDQLCTDPSLDREMLDEIVDLIVETVCSSRQTIHIARDDYPAELVKAKFMKLTGEHIQFVMDCMKQNTTKIRSIKQYLLTALFNAPSTISSYYTALVSHDLNQKP